MLWLLAALAATLVIQCVFADDTPYPPGLRVIPDPAENTVDFLFGAEPDHHEPRPDDNPDIPDPTSDGEVTVSLKKSECWDYKDPPEFRGTGWNTIDHYSATLCYDSDNPVCAYEGHWDGPLKNTCNGGNGGNGGNGAGGGEGDPEEFTLTVDGEATDTLVIHEQNTPEEDGPFAVCVDGDLVVESALVRNAGSTTTVPSIWTVNGQADARDDGNDPPETFETFHIPDDFPAAFLDTDGKPIPDRYSLTATYECPVTHETLTAAEEVIAVNVQLEQHDDNSPINPSNRMCSNAQGEFQNVKYLVKIDPNDFEADLRIAGTADVTFSDGTTLKHNVANNTIVTLEAEDNTTGTWSLTTIFPLCEVEVEEKVFKFVYKAADPLWENTGKTTKAYLKTDADTLEVNVLAHWRSNVSSMPEKNIDIEGWTMGKLTTRPNENMYTAGNVRARLKANASQVGYLETWGVMGVQSGGGMFQITGTELEWYGKLSATGGGLSPDEKDDETFKSAAPESVLLWRIDVDISKDYSINSIRTLTPEVELRTRGYVKLSGGGTGILKGRFGGAVTTLSPGLVSYPANFLDIQAIGPPMLSEFKILPAP